MRMPLHYARITPAGLLPTGLSAFAPAAKEVDLDAAAHCTILTNAGVAALDDCLGKPGS